MDDTLKWLLERQAEYEAGFPTVSDAEFDAVKRTYLASGGSWNVVGAKPLTDVTVTHNPPMLSLDNAFSLPELSKWLTRQLKTLCDAGLVSKIKMTIEDKYDGLAVKIFYKDGQYVYSALRGDGHIGDVINVVGVNGVPMSIKDPNVKELRGELLVLRSHFDLIKGDYANCRNAASGLAARSRKSTMLNQYLTFKPYDVIFYDPSKVESKSEYLSEMFTDHDVVSLFSNGTHPHHRFVCVDWVWSIIESWADRKHTLNYDTDGAVIKFSDETHRKTLGETNVYPKWAIAYKYPTDEKPTKILSVDWSLGRSGFFTPVATLQPIDLGGVTISKANLHNLDEIERLGVGVGDTVLLKRAAEVIPKITKKIQGSIMEVAIEAPKVCKHCGSPVVIKDALPWCSNKAKCQEVLIQRLMYFASKPAMDIKGLGEKTCRKLVESGAIKTIADIYNLAAESILECGITSGVTTAKMLEASISRASTVQPQRLLISLGIPEVGKATAKAMVSVYRDVKNHDKITKEQWLLVPSIGDEAANSIVSWFADPDNLALYKRLCEVLVVSVTDPKRTSSKLTGQCWILTGGVEGYTRAEIERLLLAHGANVADDYNNNVSHCYVGVRPGAVLNKCVRDGAVIVEHGFTGAKFLEALEDNAL